MQKMKRNILIVVACFAQVSMCPPKRAAKGRESAAAVSFPVLPVAFAPGGLVRGAATNHRHVPKLPRAKLAPHRTDPGAIGAKFRTVTPYQKNRVFRPLARRLAAANRESTEELRGFVVTPRVDGDLFERAAAAIDAAIDAWSIRSGAPKKKHPLSVAAYKTYAQHAESFQKEIQDIIETVRLAASPEPAGLCLKEEARDRLAQRVEENPRVLALEAKLKGFAERYKNNLVEGLRGLAFEVVPDGSNGGAFVFLMPKLGVVLKIPNPYTCYPHQADRRFNGRGGENHSLKWQVNRVPAAARINSECAEFGLRAPNKCLVLRPGATHSGSINDSQCFVMAEFIEGSEVYDKIGEDDIQQFFALKDEYASWPAERVDQIVKASEIIPSDDFHLKNFKVDTAGALCVIDTERVDAYLPPLGVSGATKAAQHGFLHPRCQQYLLGAPVTGGDIQAFFVFRVQALHFLVPPELESQRNELMRHWITEEFNLLEVRGDITPHQKRVLLEFWIGEDLGGKYFDNFDLETGIMPRRLAMRKCFGLGAINEYLAGDASAVCGGSGAR